MSTHGLPGRIQRPNSLPRHILIVPLDAAAHVKMRGLTGDDVAAIAGNGPPPPLDRIDAVLAVTVAGADVAGLAGLADACRDHGLTLSGIVLPGDPNGLPHSLAQLRASVTTLLVATEDHDVSDLAAVLRGG